MSSYKFRVAICGGGVGGLIAAVALSRHPDIQVDVYESAKAFTEIGAGIGVWPRTWKILCALGLADDLSKISMIPPTDQPKVAFHFRKGDQPEGVSFHTLTTPGGMLAFHRAEFHAVLLRHLSPHCRTHPSKRLVSYTQAAPATSRHPPAASSSSAGPSSGGITLTFRDGSSATCDVLLGADGVKSAVRSTLVHELAHAARAQGRPDDDDAAAAVLAAGPPRWSGTVAYRAVIPAESLRMRLADHRVLDNPMVYLGKNTELTVYPIARGTLVNFAAFRARYDLENTTFDGPWVEDVACEDLLADFSHWEPEVRALFQSVQRVNRWAIHTTLPLPSYVSGRVALLGDAAHAMMPYQGAGAGQSIEDAYVLATLLGDTRTTAHTLDRALRAYDAVRRPCAQRVQDASRENGLLYTLNFPGLTFDDGAEAGGVDAHKLEEIRARVRLNWEWAWRTTVDGDVRRAVGMLEEERASVSARMVEL